MIKILTIILVLGFGLENVSSTAYADPYADPNFWKDMTRTVSNIAKKIGNSVAGVVDDIKSTVGSVYKDLKSLVGNVSDKIAQPLQKLAETMNKIKNDVLRATVGKLHTFLQKLGNTIKTKFQEVVAVGEGLVNTFHDKAENFIKTKTDKVKEDVSNLLNTLKTKGEECQKKHKDDIEVFQKAALSHVLDCAVVAKEQALNVLNTVTAFVMQVPDSIREIIETGILCIVSILSEEKDFDERVSATSCFATVMTKATRESTELMTEATGLQAKVEAKLVAAQTALTVCGATALLLTSVDATQLGLKISDCF